MEHVKETKRQEPWLLSRFTNVATGESWNRLALGELEPRTRAALAVLLALLHARVAREESGLLEALAELAVVDLKRAGDAVTDRAGLAARNVAGDRDDVVVLIDRIRASKRLFAGYILPVHAD